MSKNKNFKNNAERIAYLEDKQKEITDRQENNLVFDFDDALKEDNKRKIEIKLLNKTYFLPIKMPFSFSTFFLRHCYRKINGKWTVAFEDKYLMPFLELMFGKKFLDDLERARDNRISMMFVYEKIVPKIMKEWGYDVNPDDQKKMSIQG
jgi:hypothetical protein